MCPGELGSKAPCEADCEMLSALLDLFEPLVLHLEINPLFPPPFDAWTPIASI